MFKWLFKLFGYVPVEELENLRTVMSQVQDKAVKKVPVNMDARTLFGAMVAEGNKPGNSIGHISFRDDQGDTVDDSAGYSDVSFIGESSYVFTTLNVDIPAYKGGPVGELWLMYCVDHSIEDIDVNTCCWSRQVV